MIQTEFFDWNLLGSYAGAAAAVGVLTQISKEIPGVKAIPTRLWSYLLSLATLLLHLLFTQGFTLPGAALAAFNAALVSLAANGGYDALHKKEITAQ